MNLDNLQLYAVILLAVLIIITLGVIYLHNKKINTLTQQLKKNTFEITALQSVLEGHVSQVFTGGDNSNTINLNDIRMTTTPKQVNQEEYYGDYNSHLDNQQYTENVYNNQEDNSKQEESVDEDELTDYDSDDEQITIDDVLSNAVEHDSEVNNNDDNISLIDDNDINIDDIELSIEAESNIENVLEDNDSSNNNDVVNINTESIVEEVSVVADDVSSNYSNQKETNTETVVDTEVVDTVEQTVEEKTQDTTTHKDDAVVEVESKISDKKGYRKKKSPNVSPKDYDVGTIILSENDGNYYTIYENSRGTKRWKKVKDEP